MVIASDLEAARQIEQILLDEVCRYGYNDAAAFSIRLALEEGLINAIKHGNSYDPNKIVEVLFDITPQRVAISITDQGRGFDPSAVPDPRTDENIDKPCGRGIMLMRAFMDDVQYNCRGNQVRMVKHNL